MPRKPHRVALAVTDGTPLFELAGAHEIFGVDRGLASPWYTLEVCGPRTAGVGGWLRARPEHGLDRLATASTVVVPAWRDLEEEPPGALIAALRAAHAAGARIVSLCTGAFVLAAAGLLDDRPATTHWAHTDLLAERHPRVRVRPDVLYVDDGTVLTSAGKAAGIDLCLHVVRVDHGAAVANAIARTLVVPPHRSGGQAQFVPAPVPATDDHVLADLMAWAGERLDQPLTVTDLARRANLSTRTLARHFAAVAGTSPLRWLLAQRVHRAQELLETTDASVEQIAARTGMGTATTLRRHVNRVLGLPPEAYRRTFHLTR
ncbi:helix-turn-helix domain-containing protein [Virgisporangium ochraceum]|uniref:helix-turn-helix domain-containing protein n=1 Tax=Virgisporangium ochraceum TaxID=65505 RepID=UPI001940FD5A|nr:helix-turn-helix domain-containing protein [Virgisporangium ochraceum]